MKTVRVKLPHPKDSYSVFIQPWNLNHSLSVIKKYLNEKRLFIVTNHQIKKLYQKKIQSAFHKQLEIIWISIPDGEKYKTLSTCEYVLTQLSLNNAHRKSHLLALGGGVVGDITGFVASSYMRGIKYFQMPTTLLSQVDSSVGGKTGVDLVTGKNLVGAFYQPKAVFIHTDFLKTLSSREIKCGIAEIIKYGIIGDPQFFDYLGHHSKDILNLKASALEKIIHRSCQIKSEVVKKDEKESSLRAILNYGHTLGHAIEALNGFKKIKHGEAVSMGMVYAAQLSHKLKYSIKDHSPEIENILKMYQLPTQRPFFFKKKFEQTILRDKKSTGEKIKFILLKKIGKVGIVSLNIKDATACL